MAKQAKQTAATPATVDKLRKWKSGEQVSRTRTVIEPNKVRASFTVSNSTDSYVVDDCVFDFEGVSHDELMLLAMRGSVIAVQNRARELLKNNLADAIDRKNWASVNVKSDVVDTERKSATPVEKASKLVGKLSAEDRAALLAMLSDGGSDS